MAVHTDECANVASIGRFDVLGSVGVHTDQFLDGHSSSVSSGREDLSSRQLALVDSEIGQLTETGGLIFTDSIL